MSNQLVTMEEIENDDYSTEDICQLRIAYDDAIFDAQRLREYIKNLQIRTGCE
jgi:hypothetical protein